MFVSSLGQIEQGNQQFDQAISPISKSPAQTSDFDFCRQQLCALISLWPLLPMLLRYFDERLSRDRAASIIFSIQSRASRFARSKLCWHSKRFLEKALISHQRNKACFYSSPLICACVAPRSCPTTTRKRSGSKSKTWRGTRLLSGMFPAQRASQSCRQYQEAIQLEANNLTLHQNYFITLSVTLLQTAVLKTISSRHALSLPN